MGPVIAAGSVLVGVLAAARLAPAPVPAAPVIGVGLLGAEARCGPAETTGTPWGLDHQKANTRRTVMGTTRRLEGELAWRPSAPLLLRRLGRL